MMAYSTSDGTRHDCQGRGKGEERRGEERRGERRGEERRGEGYYIVQCSLTCLNGDVKRYRSCHFPQWQPAMCMKHTSNGLKMDCRSVKS